MSSTTFREEQLKRVAEVIHEFREDDGTPSGQIAEMALRELEAIGPVVAQAPDMSVPGTGVMDGVLRELIKQDRVRLLKDLIPDLAADWPDLRPVLVSALAAVLAALARDYLASATHLFGALEALAVLAPEMMEKHGIIPRSEPPAGKEVP